MKKTQEQQPAPREDDVLRRMLATPPAPHKTAEKAAAKKTPKKPAPG